jgi:hypothetical protein
MVALRASLVTGVLFMWSCLQATEWLTSLDRIDGGRVLSCDYEFVSDHYLLTCEDVYEAFSLQCFADVGWSHRPSLKRGEGFGVICPVKSDHSNQGNALRLECLEHDSKDIERMRNLAGQHPELHPRIRMAQCSSEKVDFDWDAFRLRRP